MQKRNEKCSKMEPKTVPKCFVGSGKICFHDHFVDLKQAWWSQRCLHKASSCSFCSFSSHLDLSFSILQLLWHYRQCIFDLQSSSHSSINELCCQQLVYQTSGHTAGFNVHHSLLTISDHISHVGSLSLFSEFPLTRVSNTRTYNQGMTKQLSPIDYPINLSPRSSCLRVNR